MLLEVLSNREKGNGQRHYTAPASTRSRAARAPGTGPPGPLHPLPNVVNQSQSAHPPGGGARRSSARRCAARTSGSARQVGKSTSSTDNGCAFSLPGSTAYPCRPNRRPRIGSTASSWTPPRGVVGRSFRRLISPQAHGAQPRIESYLRHHIHDRAQHLGRLT